MRVALIGQAPFGERVLVEGTSQIQRVVISRALLDRQLVYP